MSGIIRNTCIGPMTGIILLEAEALKLRCGLMAALKVWGAERHDLADLADMAAGDDYQGDHYREMAMRFIDEMLAKGPEALPDELAKGEPDEGGRGFGAVARVTAEALRERLPRAWGRLLALEEANRKALGELGAGDAMPEEIRACMQSARADLELAAKECGKTLPDIRLPEEPDEQMAVLLRQRVLEGR
jgi:hypothetical protein